ncbi:MAG: Acetyl xylan esterase, partial [uncultured Thermomicrobiales bacterium]
RELRGPRPEPGALLDGVDGPHLPAIDGLRRLQPLCRAEGHPRLALQRARGGRRAPDPGQGEVPARDLANGV